MLEQLIIIKRTDYHFKRLRTMKSSNFLKTTNFEREF